MVAGIGFAFFFPLGGQYDHGKRLPTGKLPTDKPRFPSLLLLYLMILYIDTTTALYAVQECRNEAQSLAQTERAIAAGYVRNFREGSKSRLSLPCLPIYSEYDWQATERVQTLGEPIVAPGPPQEIVGSMRSVGRRRTNPEPSLRTGGGKDSTGLL